MRVRSEAHKARLRTKRKAKLALIASIIGAVVGLLNVAGAAEAPDDPQPGITVTQSVNGKSAPDVDLADGGSVTGYFRVPADATAVDYKATVTNTGDIALKYVFAWTAGFQCGQKTELEPGESMTCSAKLPPGFDFNATASGAIDAPQDVASRLGMRVEDQNTVYLTTRTEDHWSSFSFIAYVNETRAIPDVIELPADATTRFSYSITNDGTDALRNIELSDTLTGHVACPKTEIAPHEVMVCTSAAPASPANTVRLTASGTEEAVTGTLTMRMHNKAMDPASKFFAIRTGHGVWGGEGHVEGDGICTAFDLATAEGRDAQQKYSGVWSFGGPQLFPDSNVYVVTCEPGPGSVYVGGDQQATCAGRGYAEPCPNPVRYDPSTGAILPPPVVTAIRSKLPRAAVAAGVGALAIVLRIVLRLCLRKRRRRP